MVGGAERIARTPLIVIIVIACNNPRVMGRHVNGRWLNVLGLGASLVMTIAAIAMMFG